MHTLCTRLPFKARLALAGLFVLGLIAAFGDAEAATKSGSRPAPQLRPAATKPVANLPSSSLAPRLNPGLAGGMHAGRFDPGASSKPPTLAPPTSGRFPPPTFTPVAGNAQGGNIKDTDRTGAPPATLPTPSAEDRNRKAGACLVGIVSACNGDLPSGDKNAGGTNNGGNAGGNTGANTGGGSGGQASNGNGGGGGGSFSPSFSFGGGDSSGGTLAASAKTANADATPACVADPNDVYKRLECNLADFKAGKIDRRAFEANKTDALALLDPEKLGSDLVFRVLRELVDLKLITTDDREAQKRILLAKL